MDPELEELAKRYSELSDSSDSVQGRMEKLYRGYARERGAALIDAAAAAATVAGIVNVDQVDLSRVTPQMQEAWDLAYPNVDLDSLVNRDSEAVSGFINGWKGKYFEVIVRDDLNAGKWMGDVGLGPGESAALAESPTQPGWDLQIFNSDGSVAQELQLKAAASLGPVKIALERYPDIDILATDEAAAAASDWADQVIASGISEQDLEEAVTAPLSSLLDSPAMELLEDLLPFATLVPFAIIVTQEGKQVMMGRKDFELGVSDGLGRIVTRGLKTGASIFIGAVVAWMDGGLLSIPATILTRLGIDRALRMGSLSRRLEERMRELRLLQRVYAPPSAAAAFA